MLATSQKICSIFSCETGTLVFATLNLMIWALGTAAGFVGFLYCSVNEADSNSILLMTAYSQISFFLLMFGAFLFHGVLKKHSELIKAYLVLGATVLFLSGFAVLAAIPMSFWLYLPIPLFWYWSPDELAVMVIVQVVYTLILAMVYNTYRKIKNAEELNELFNKITKMLDTPSKSFPECPSHTGTVIFASLNLIGSVLGVLGGAAGIIHCYVSDDYQCNNKLGFLLSSEISLFTMVFAAFLFHGLLKKNRKHIKVYLVMGLVILFSSNIGFLVVVPMGIWYPSWPIPPFRRWNIGFLALTVALQVAYALILGMIYNTYKNMKAHANKSKEQDEQKVFLIENMSENLSTPVHKLLY